ncbi:MAG TPA: hypothetical protein VJ000_04845 [Thermodesulfovibrionia bacterium]|nr:hypothetical protein [Thermodesulfovibrionia bacterium]
MKESIEGFLLSLEKISKDIRIRELKVIEKTKSILKARLYFSNDIFVQIYVNIKRPKKNYALIINDIRIFGKDYIFGLWHLYPFESPQKHDDSEKARKPVTIEEFVEEATFILSEKLGMI